MKGRNLASPYSLALFSYLFFLFSWLFPGSIYSDYLNEPDLLFLNYRTLAFFSCCVFAFIAGVWASSRRGIMQLSGLPQREARRPLTYLVVPLLISTFFAAFTWL